MGIVSRLRELRARYGLRRGLARELGLLRARLLDRVTASRLARELAALGVRRGDVVFVHTALSRIGHVIGGPAAVIRAIEAAVGPTGTVLMPAYSTGGLPYDWVIEKPVFDVRRTRADVGAVPETFRMLPGTRRSLHPTHSGCARGAKADLVTEGHERSVRPFGPGTPFAKLAELGGKGVLLGARLRNFTALRIVEDGLGEAYPVPVYCPEPFAIDVIDAAGARRTVRTLVPDPAWSRRRDGDLLLPGLRARGLVTEGTVGRAPTLVVDCARLLDALEDLTARGVLAYRA